MKIEKDSLWEATIAVASALGWELKSPPSAINENPRVKQWNQIARVAVLAYLAHEKHKPRKKK